VDFSNFDGREAGQRWHAAVLGQAEIASECDRKATGCGQGDGQGSKQIWRREAWDVHGLEWDRRRSEAWVVRALAWDRRRSEAWDVRGTDEAKHGLCVGLRGTDEQAKQGCGIGHLATVEKLSGETSKAERRDAEQNRYTCIMVQNERMR